jgi:hypothetical protein
VLAALLALALAAPPKVAVVPLASGEGVPGKTAEALTESVTAEVRRRSGAQVVSQREITTLLSLEQQKAMLGCQNDACFAELGGALGAERVVSGDLSRLGESWLLHLKLLDSGKAQVLATSDRRLRGGTIDDVLDALPAMVGELFPRPPTAAAAPPPVREAPPAGPPAQPRQGEGPAVTPAVVRISPGSPLEATPPAGPQPPAEPGPLPPPTAPMPGRSPARAVLPAFLERSIPVPLRLRGEMTVFGDGQGGFLALAPFGEKESPVFFGSAGKLYRQEVAARREQETTGYEVALWDPRVPGGQALVSLRGDRAVIRCGDRQLELQALGLRERRRLLVATTYYAPPFVRKPVGLARDDEGNFFFLDDAREPGQRGPDYRLYAGPKGALARLEIEELGREGDAVLLRTAQGRLRFRREGEAGGQADWLAGGGKRALAWLDTAGQGPMIFGELGVYGGQRLGTVCDPLLAGR